MLRSFPELRIFIVCGIAGGIPGTRGQQRDIRLGDVVVATDGVIDYGHVRRVDGVDSLRRQVSGLSTTLLRADRLLQAAEIAGRESWLGALDTAARNETFRRPSARTDPRYPAASADDRAGRPRLWRGMIGSADLLLRDAAWRDELAARYGVMAVEMEASGVAATADEHERHWFEVRGISDYCDNSKNDAWHGYAAAAAAAYVRGLLAECQPIGGLQGESRAANGFQTIVDCLLDLAPMNDDYQRRAILAQLPGHIRAAVPDSVTARIHVVGLVRTCERFPDGRRALLDALRVTIGPASADFQRVESVIRSNWSGS
jgi:nucleoside phosphorylase